MGEANEIFKRFKNHEISLTRPSHDTNWYIRVRAPDGLHVYDGWWRDSADKSSKDALLEAKRGAMLLPSPSRHPPLPDCECHDCHIARTRTALAAPAAQSDQYIPLAEAGWTLIELGFGLVEVAEGRQPVERVDGSHDERPALIFGRNGSGKVGDPLAHDRQMLPGEPLAVVTFANVESVDVVMGKLALIRERLAAGS